MPISTPKLAGNSKMLRSKKKNALGRGLSALIPDGDMGLLNGDSSKSNDVRQVKVQQIIANPNQPRRQFPQQELEELAASIREHGVLQPILLRTIQETDGKIYEIIAGERRWRAAQLANLTSVPALIHEMNEGKALEIAIIENVQRQDINSIDAAAAYQRLQREFHLSQEEIAKRVSKSRTAIANTLRLLDLPEEVQSAISQQLISEGHGRAILGAKSNEARRAILRHILRDGLTVRQAEELARNSNAQTSEKADTNTPKLRSADERRVEERLQQALGTRVHFMPKGKSGQIVITYFSADELEGILEKLER